METRKNGSGLISMYESFVLELDGVSYQKIPGDCPECAFLSDMTACEAAPSCNGAPHGAFQQIVVA